jgi:hypothetical protein
MASPSEPPADRQSRLERVLAECLRAEEAGSAVDTAALLAAHPDLADELASFFANRAALDRLAEPLREATALAEQATLPPDGSGPGEAAGAAPRVRYFGDYELLQEIAHGGMGVVYRARQVSLNRPVALKMILAGQLASLEDVQ